MERVAGRQWLGESFLQHNVNSWEFWLEGFGPRAFHKSGSRPNRLVVGRSPLLVQHPLRLLCAGWRRGEVGPMRLLWFVKAALSRRSAKIIGWTGNIPAKFFVEAVFATKIAGSSPERQKL